MSESIDDLRKELNEHDDIDVLYAAAANYVENRGGKIVVIGGIQAQEWPDDLDLNFQLALKMTGREPPCPPCCRGRKSAQSIPPHPARPPPGPPRRLTR